MPIRRVALTGGIATGKSVVRTQCAALGVPTSDADARAREAVAPGSPGLAAVAARFGPAVIGPDGALDRAALAAIVFRDRDARLALERIVHPIVQAETEAWFQSLPPTTRFAVAEIPLLYELGREKDFDAVVVVACAPHIQRTRLLGRGLTEREADSRLAAQRPIEEKVRRADYVIRTDGTLEETAQATSAVCAALAARWGGGPAGPAA